MSGCTRVQYKAGGLWLVSGWLAVHAERLIMRDCGCLPGTDSEPEAWGGLHFGQGIY